MLLKLHPQDFVVEEIPELPPLQQSGSHSIIRLVKTNRNTLDVVREISRQLHMPLKDVGFAGLKDKNAITTQHLSLRAKTQHDIEQVRIDNCSISFQGYASQPIRLGDLRGNKFTIVVRQLGRPLVLRTTIPNYYGEQRFSTKNVAVGRAIVRQDFTHAVNILSAEVNNSDLERMHKRYQIAPSDPIGALRQLPRKLLTLYISAYQSYLWNCTAATYLRKFPHTSVEESFGTLVFPETSIKASIKNIPVPIIGFSTKLEEPLIDGIGTILAQENITPRSFIIRAFPELSSPGSVRDLLIDVQELTIATIDATTQQASFILPKGSFATVAVLAMAQEQRKQ